MRFTHLKIPRAPPPASRLQAQVDGQAQSLLALCSFADALQAKREAVAAALDLAHRGQV